MAYDLPRVMKAMVLNRPGEELVLAERPLPRPGPGQILVKVSACGVCRTDLHVVDGDLTEPSLPIVPGHEIVGHVAGLGTGVSGFAPGERVGVPWLGHTCGTCPYCTGGHENLCDAPGFTGYQIDGGYAEYTVADADYCFPIAEGMSDEAAAPLLCAGLIGHRSLKMTGDGERLGIYGFGAAAHIVAQVAQYQAGKSTPSHGPAMMRRRPSPSNRVADWAGASDVAPPDEFDAAIIFAPVGALLPSALRAVRKGGIVVCGGIHMSDIPSFPYDILWGERSVKSVANLTRRDAEEFLNLAPRVPVKTQVETLPLHEANQALRRLRSGDVNGAFVLMAG